VNIKRKTKENGSALIFTILILFILSVLGSVLISVAMSNFSLIRHGNNYDTVYFIADGAAEEVISEIDIITQNAEYESLSATSEYAEDHKGDPEYVQEIESGEDDGKKDKKKPKPDDETTYTYNETGFKQDLQDKFETDYKDEIVANLVSACENVEFDPDFGNNFDEGKPDVSVTVPTPLFLGNTSNDIEIEIVGRYNNMERKIKLTFSIYLPSYKFNVSTDSEGKADHVYYNGYERNPSPSTNFSYKWEETNLN